MRLVFYALVVKRSFLLLQQEIILLRPLHEENPFNHLKPIFFYLWIYIEFMPDFITD